MPPQIENSFTHRRKSQDVLILAERSTPHVMQNTISCRKSALPLVGCLVTCNAAHVLHDSTAQVIDSSDNKADTKGQDSQTTHTHNDDYYMLLGLFTIRHNYEYDTRGH